MTCTNLLKYHQARKTDDSPKNYIKVTIMKTAAMVAITVKQLYDLTLKKGLSLNQTIRATQILLYEKHL